jgi:hypothetical protein
LPFVEQWFYASTDLNHGKNTAFVLYDQTERSNNSKFVKFGIDNAHLQKMTTINYEVREEKV